MHLLGLLAAEGDDASKFVDIDVQPWQWGVLLAIIISLLMIDLLIIHRKPHVIHIRQAAIEAAIWVSCGLAFALVIWAWFGGAAAGEYLSGYLIEESLSIDNVFVWALILAYFRVPAEYQHRVLFWGIFGALVLRATFIFAGIALIERFDWVLYIFGAFLLYTAGKLIFSDNEHVDPGKSRFLKVVNRIVPSTDSSTVRSCSRESTANDSRRHCSPCSCWSRAPTCCSPSTACRRCSRSVASSSSCSRRTRSRSSGCERCTSCSPTCTDGSRTSSRDWRSSSPSSA